MSEVQGLIKVGRWGTPEWGGPIINGKSFFHGEGGAEEYLLDLLVEYRPPLYFVERRGMVGQRFLAISATSASGAKIPDDFCTDIYPWIADELLSDWTCGDISAEGVTCPAYVEKAAIAAGLKIADR